MTIVVRTHGGLGNQIFQILFARLKAQTSKMEYVELHDDSYAHKFSRSSELKIPTEEPTKVQRLISALRAPKVLTRMHLIKTEKLNVFGDVFLDGYFQQASDFSKFSDALIAAQINVLRTEFDISPTATKIQRKLYHIRLGDFFSSSEDALNHATERIGKLEDNSVIITNQESLFTDPNVHAKILAKHCTLHGTSTYASEDVLRFMSQHAQIVTNNSTLALWAAVLGNCKTDFDDERLTKVHRTLFKIANPSQ